MLSTHIVGGEIFYDRITDSTYKITLKVYRDCVNGQAPFDGVNDGGPYRPAMLTVYTADSTLVGSYDIGAPVITQIPPTINNPCIKPPLGICVEEGVYTYTLTLPQKNGGYYVIYQTGMRNATILNLVTPLTQGSTYYTFIPGPDQAAINSSPRFNSFPPIYICNAIPFNFNHAATDPDGDQLVYSLGEPYQGIYPGCPNYTTPGCPTQADPPPYSNVYYTAPYSGAYPIAANPAFSIDSTSGILTGQPNMFGQFVVGICVKEFRGGNLINTHYRDFQFNVVSCIVQVASVFANQISKCEGSTITFTNQSFGNLGALTYLWDFGDTTITSDISTATNPSYTYQDTGKYVVTLIANPNKPCSDTVKKTVYVYPKLEIDFPHVATQCFKGNAFSFAAQGSYLPYANFNWNFTAAGTPSTSTLINPINITFNQPGKYFVKLVAKQLTCIDSFIDSVRVVKPPIAKINNIPSSWCAPAKVAFSNGSSSQLPVTYQWLFSNGNSSHVYEPAQVFSIPGIYSATLVVKATSICLDTSTAAVKNITVNPTPNAGFTFSPQVTSIFDPEITVFNNASADVITWDYAFGDGGSTSNGSDLHVYQAYGDYAITQIVANSFNCKDTAVGVVKILPEFRFWIPNTFTPDGNLLNDVFMPIAVGIVDYEFNIFDNWGELIYRTKNLNEGWNGFYKGELCKEDVYTWQIKFKNVINSRNETHFGKIYLLKHK